MDAAAGGLDSMRTLVSLTARGWKALADDELWN